MAADNPGNKGVFLFSWRAAGHAGLGIRAHPGRLVGRPRLGGLWRRCAARPPAPSLRGKGRTTPARWREALSAKRRTSRWRIASWSFSKWRDLFMTERFKDLSSHRQAQPHQRRRARHPPPRPQGRHLGLFRCPLLSDRPSPVPGIPDPSVSLSTPPTPHPSASTDAFERLFLCALPARGNRGFENQPLRRASRHERHSSQVVRCRPPRRPLVRELREGAHAAAWQAPPRFWRDAIRSTVPLVPPVRRMISSEYLPMTSAGL
jgi:hypothetical protein